MFVFHFQLFHFQLIVEFTKAVSIWKHHLEAEDGVKRNPRNKDAKNVLLPLGSDLAPDRDKRNIPSIFN